MATNISRFMVSSALVALVAPVSQAWAQQTTSSPPTADQSQTQAQSQSATGAASSNASPDAAQVGDIIVTAQKRSQSLRDVPIAITVVSAEQLSRQQITNVTDLKRIAPSLEFGEPTASPGGGAFIRGLGTTISAGSGEPSTSLVVDGVPQGKLPLLNLFDVERVEVLRGPQGTLFGQSVSSGVINIATVAPKLGIVEGFYRVQVAGDGTAGSEYGRIVSQAGLNVPLGDKVALRVSGHYDDVSGLANNTFLPKDDQENYGVRARLYAEPVDAVRINLIGEYNRISGNNTPFFSYRDTNNPVLLSTLQACGTPAGPANTGNCSHVPDTNRENLYGLSGQIDVDLGGPTLTSITAYRQQDDVDSRGIDHLPPSSPTSPFPNIQFGGNRSQKLFSQELRLASASNQQLEWVVGGFYSNYKQNYDYSSSLGLFFLPAPIITAYYQTPKNEQFAGFGQATLRVFNGFRLIGGARVTRDKVTAANTVAGKVYSASDSVTNFSWRIGAQYDVAARNVLYGTISRGFKGQTFDDTSVPNSTPPLIQPEIPTAYEIGLKGAVGRLNYDLNAFIVNVSNYQAQVCVNDPARGQICLPQNIRSLTSKGFEAAIFGRVVPGLDVTAGVAYTHAVYPAGYLGTDGRNLGGQQIVNSPRWKLTGSAEYSHALTSKFGAFIAGDATWRSSTRLDTSLTDRVVYPAHWLVGGRLGVRTSDGKLEVAIFARNIFNIHEPVLLFNSVIGAAAATATTPAYVTTAQIAGENFWRQVGLSASLKF